MTILRHRSLTRVSAPASEPVTLPEAKQYIRVDHANEDILISDLIVAARMSAEHWLKRSLITQSWKLAYDEYVPEEIYLPMGPVSSITSVIEIGRDGTPQTIDSNVYYLNAAKDRIVLDTTLVAFRVEVTYVAGYGNASAVPRPIKQGILAHIASMYDGRGDSADMMLPEQSMRLYMPFREISL